jgi:cell shape-determining protein MreD
VAALGILALLLEGALAALVDVRWIPDFGLLVPIAAALWLGPAEGLLVAAGIGLAADTLSGSLLGQQAFLRLLEFTVTRAVASKLDLRRPLPLTVFVLAVGLADAAAMGGLTRLFLGELPLSTRQLGGLAMRAAMSALFAPLVAGVVRGFVERRGEFEARREMRLDTRRPAF